MNSSSLGEFFNFLRGHFWFQTLLFDEVVFIPYNNDFDISLTMLLNLLEPDVQVVKRLLLEEIEAENNALRTFVVRVGDCAVSLLTCSVPDL